VTRGDDQVGPLHDAVVVHLVVVHQSAAGRLGDADALVAVDLCSRTNVRRQDVGAAQELLDLLDEWSVSIRRA
jgi:hypothetical protein